MEGTFGFLLFNDVEELDLVGPWEVISVWSNKFGGPTNVITVSETAGTIRCAKGLKIISDHDFQNCPKLDYLIVPGGLGERSESSNKVLTQFIADAATNCKAVLSVCTGALLLQAAGLLDGKKATTHWQSLVRLRKFDKTTVIEERWVKDGKIWTAAGVSSGIDLALALIADVAGDEVAGEIQFYMEYYPLDIRYGSAHLTDAAPKYINK